MNAYLNLWLCTSEQVCKQSDLFMSSSGLADLGNEPSSDIFQILACKQAMPENLWCLNIMEKLSLALLDYRLQLSPKLSEAELEQVMLSLGQVRTKLKQLVQMLSQILKSLLLCFHLICTPTIGQKIRFEGATSGCSFSSFYAVYRFCYQYRSKCKINNQRIKWKFELSQRTILEKLL